MYICDHPREKGLSREIFFSRFPRISQYYSHFYLRTKFDRLSFRYIATFIHGRRKSTIAETAIFVRLRVVRNVSGYASAYFLV